MKRILVIALVTLLVCVSAFAALVDPSAVKTLELEPVPVETVEDSNEEEFAELIAALVEKMANLIESLDEETAKKIVAIAEDEKLSFDEMIAQLTAELGEEKMAELVEISDQLDNIDIDFETALEIIDATVDQLAEDAAPVEVTEVVVEEIED